MKIFITSVMLMGIVTISEAAITVGIVSDGESPTLAEARTLLIREIRKASEGEFTVRFPESKQINAGFSVERARNSIEKLQKDSEVDMVLLVGSTTSQIALNRAVFEKPTFAPFVYSVSLSGLAKKTDRLSRRNLNYVTGESQLDEEIQVFQTIVPFRKIGVVLEESQYRLYAKAAEDAVLASQKHGIDLFFIRVKDHDGKAIDKIPADLDAVMVAPLNGLDNEMRKKWIQALNERKLPTYALGDGAMVYEGILASSVEKGDLSRRARRTALNILEVMRGAKAQEQPVDIERKSQLIINMQTARSIGVYPTFAVLSNAILLNKTEEKEPSLSFSTVAKEAIRANLNIISAKLGVAANKENIAEVRSTLFPKITGELGYSQLNSGNVYVENGFYPQKSVSGAIKLQQILFSEKALANLEIQKELHVAVEEQQRSLEIEVVKQAMTAFLNVLMAQTHYRIQQDNLALTQTNLELANGRVRAGTSDMSDVYYWESAIATVRQNVLQAEADVEKAKDGLNFILNRNIGERFITEPATLNDPGLYVKKQAISNLIANQRDFDTLTEFFVHEGIENIPRLHQLSAQMRAQKRQVLSDERGYWSPDIIFAADVSHVLDETRNGGAGIDMENETDWQAGIKLSLPLYEGGARRARSSRSQLKLQQLEVNYQDELRAIEQRIRSDLHMLKASYSSIALSEEAALAAKKSFEMVRENYAQGTRTMSDLLASQNASLIADKASANTVHRFMMDMVQLQQDIGAFELFSDNFESERLITRLKSYISNGSKENQMIKGNSNAENNF
jgi:outer membrane protein TolC/ABC-type uncharacterized transport system substrate-binding protein